MRTEPIKPMHLIWNYLKPFFRFKNVNTSTYKNIKGHKVCSEKRNLSTIAKTLPPQGITKF